MIIAVMNKVVFFSDLMVLKCLSKQNNVVFL